MSEPGEATGSERPCGLSSLLPIGMSCRGRAEAFARRLQSRLRTLGTQVRKTTTTNPTNFNQKQFSQPTTSPNNTNGSENAWLSENESQVTSLQPLRHLNNEADSFFDFDIDQESPGSPAEECEYSRLIETASNTPHDLAPESGYVCASPISPEGSLQSHSSSDGQYFDPENSDLEQKSITTTTNEYYDCIDPKKDFHIKINHTMPNGHINFSVLDSSDSCSESLPQSQSTDTNSTCTTAPPSSSSNSTLQDDEMLQKDEVDHCKENGISFVENLENIEKLVKEQFEIPQDDEETEILLNKKQRKNYTLECSNNKHIETPQVEEQVEEEVEEEEIIEEEEKKIDEEPKQHLSASTDDDETEDNRPQRVRRCSSLKTGKTPPGTPGRKKIVRFADVLGLDLADVRTFLDEIPKIPKSAFEDLEFCDLEQNQLIHGPISDKVLLPLFQQPGGLPNFLDMVRERQVCLENAAVTDPICLTISGCVRVRNLDFHKSVHIRYSQDSWRSFADLQATYVQNSCDGFSDKFTFVLFGNALKIGQRLEMACRFSCKGQQFWDSNYGNNYSFQCLPTTLPARPFKPAAQAEDFGASFY